jgi:predicted RNA-binding Zn ribbon-like protein
MHWVEVDGVRLPKRVGGHPALDFCNTWAGWGEPSGDPRGEWLGDYDRLALWARLAELVDEKTTARLRRTAAGHPADAALELAKARELRAGLHEAVLDPSSTRALQTVSREVREAAQHATLRPGPERRPRWELDSSAGLALPRLAVAQAAADLLASEDLNRVKACPGDDCGWVFVDRSGRRRWCSMSACGNRAKVRAFAARHR